MAQYQALFDQLTIVVNHQTAMISTISLRHTATSIYFYQPPVKKM